MAWLTEVPGDAIVKGDLVGWLGFGASSCACCVVCCCGGGAGACAVAGFCCCAICWPGGGEGGLGVPARRASSNLRSSSFEGVFVLARRFLSETMSVLGG